MNDEVCLGDLYVLLQMEEGEFEFGKLLLGDGNSWGTDESLAKVI